jgi:hypothetical protein
LGFNGSRNFITATRKYERIYREQRLGINREGVQRKKRMRNCGQEGGRHGI